jgi:hypothetical protein
MCVCAWLGTGRIIIYIPVLSVQMAFRLLWKHFNDKELKLMI